MDSGRRGKGRDVLAPGEGEGGRGGGGGEHAAAMHMQLLAW